MDVNFSKAANAYQSRQRSMDGMAGAGMEDDSGPSFGDLLKESLNQTVSSLDKAEEMKTQALTGKAELSDLVTAVANAELTLNTVVTIRDRVISAYQDILRMPI